MQGTPVIARDRRPRAGPMSLRGDVRRRDNVGWAAFFRPAPVPGRCPGLCYAAPHKGGAAMALRGGVRRRGDLSPYESVGQALFETVITSGNG